MKYVVQILDREIALDINGTSLVLDEQSVDFNITLLAQTPQSVSYHVLVKNHSHVLTIEPQEGNTVIVTLNGRRIEVTVKDETALLLERFGMADAETVGLNDLHAPMPGLVRSILVAVGQSVSKGDGVAVLEAMKMENELKARADGIVAAIHVEQGQAVGKTDLLVSFES